MSKVFFPFIVSYCRTDKAPQKTSEHLLLLQTGSVCLVPHAQSSVRHLAALLTIHMPPPVDFSHRESIQTLSFSSQRQEVGLITVCRQSNNSLLFQMQIHFAEESQIHVNENSIPLLSQGG